MNLLPWNTEVGDKLRSFSDYCSGAEDKFSFLKQHPYTSHYNPIKFGNMLGNMSKKTCGNMLVYLDFNDDFKRNVFETEFSSDFVRKVPVKHKII